MGAASSGAEAGCVEAAGCAAGLWVVSDAVGGGGEVGEDERAATSGGISGAEGGSDEPEAGGLVVGGEGSGLCAVGAEEDEV